MSEAVYRWGKHRLTRAWRWTQVFDKLGRPAGQPFRINLKGGAFKGGAFK